MKKPPPPKLTFCERNPDHPRCQTTSLPIDTNIWILLTFAIILGFIITRRNITHR